jgi:phosphoenolpyruvate carboxykinase (ATP)
MKISHTRAMIRAALEGKLADARLTPDPIFKVGVPEEIDGVPTEVLSARSTWADKGAYDKQAKELAGRFRENFEQYASQAAKEITQAGPG